MAGVRTLGRLTGINVVNALLALLNTVIVAYYFGTGRPVEVYLAAAGLYASLMSLTQTGQVSEILLPTYHQVRERLGAEAAFGIYTALVNRLLLAFGLLCLGGWVFAPTLAAWRVPGFEPAEIATVSEMFRWILPLVLLRFAAELFKTLANAESLFGGPEILTGAARVASLIALAMLAADIGPWALVVGLWSSVLVEILGSLWLLRRRSYRYVLRFRLPDGTNDVRLFARLGGTLPYVVLTQAYQFLLDAVLSQLAQGSFAVFRYASMIWSRTRGVFLRPVNVTFFTEFSESNARNSRCVHGLLEQSLARALAISALVAVGVLSGAGLALENLWQSERFSAEQIRDLVWLLGGFYVMLPVVGTSVILRKVAVSLGLVSEIYLGLAVVQVLSGLLAWTMVPMGGLVGALLVTAFQMIGFCIVPILVLKLTKSPVELRYPFDRAWRWLVACAIGVIAAWLTQQALPAMPPSLSGRILGFAAGGALAIVGLTAAFGASWLLAVPESRLLAVRVRRILGK